MKALVYTSAKRLAYKDVSPPKPKADEKLVAVKAVGICGSDMHAYKGHDDRRPAPLILGHEVAGTLQSGERVTVNPLVTCMKCDYCRSNRSNLCPDRQILSMPPRQGGFAEYITIPERNLVTLTNNISFCQGALAEPIAVGWHAIKLAKQLHPMKMSESSMLIIGGGAIGLASALVARHFTVASISIAEINPARHAPLLAAGNFKVINPTSNEDIANVNVDIVIDAHGNTDTQSLASRVIRPGGVIINVGLAGGNIGLDVRKMTLQDIRFAGSYTYTHEDFTQTTNAMFSGKLGSLDWFETHALNEGEQMFNQLDEGKIASSKVILVPDE